jgi:hypothetical protein
MQWVVGELWKRGIGPGDMIFVFDEPVRWEQQSRLDPGGIR